MREIDGTGAAGGIAGALVALGGRLLPGFELVADELDLHDAVAAADVVITGEGYLDEQSFEGKVVGGVQEMATAAGKPVGAIVGDASPEAASRIDHVSLVDVYGNDTGDERAAVVHRAAPRQRCCNGLRRSRRAGCAGRRQWSKWRGSAICANVLPALSSPSKNEHRVVGERCRVGQLDWRRHRLDRRQRPSSHGHRLRHRLCRGIARRRTESW